MKQKNKKYRADIELRCEDYGKTREWLGCEIFETDDLEELADFINACTGRQSEISKGIIEYRISFYYPKDENGALDEYDAIELYTEPIANFTGESLAEMIEDDIEEGEDGGEMADEGVMNVDMDESELRWILRGLVSLLNKDMEQEEVDRIKKLINKYLNL